MAWATSSGRATRPNGLCSRISSPAGAVQMVAGHVCLDPAGRDDTDDDAVRGQVFGEGLAHGVEAGFAGAVGGAGRLAAKGAAGGDVDDTAVPLADHLLRGAVADIGRADEVGVEDAPPAFLPGLIVYFSQRVVFVDAGVVDDDVETAVVVNGAPARARDTAVRVGQIGAQHQVRPTGQAGALSPARRPRSDGQWTMTRALGGELLRRRRGRCHARRPVTSTTLSSNRMRFMMRLLQLHSTSGS